MPLNIWTLAVSRRISVAISLLHNIVSDRLIKSNLTNFGKGEFTHMNTTDNETYDDEVVPVCL